jgi:hypothetical protein
MFHYIEKFVEVNWKHGSGGGSALQIFLEVEAEAKWRHFHTTVKCNSIFNIYNLRIIVLKNDKNNSKNNKLLLKNKATFVS